MPSRHIRPAREGLRTYLLLRRRHDSFAVVFGNPIVRLAANIDAQLVRSIEGASTSMEEIR